MGMCSRFTSSLTRSGRGCREETQAVDRETRGAAIARPFERLITYTPATEWPAWSWQRDMSAGAMSRCGIIAAEPTGLALSARFWRGAIATPSASCW